MQTAEFAQGLDALLEFAHAGTGGAEAATAVMCAESRWWQCHRRLLSDALLVRGVPVRHILAHTAPEPHELTAFARVDGGKVIYPGLL